MPRRLRGAGCPGGGVRRGRGAAGGPGGRHFSNDRTGVLTIRSSTLRGNPSDGFPTAPGIFFLGRAQLVVHSTIR